MGPFPTGLVTFLSAVDGEPPENWEEYQPAQGRLLLAAKDASQLGLTGGAPVGPGQVPTHTHALSGTVSVPHYKTSTVDGSNKSVAKSGSHAAKGSLTEAELGLGFLHLRVVRSLGSPAGDVDDDQGDPLPYGSVAFFDRVPPPSWRIRSTWAGCFVLPSSGTTVQNGTPWDPTGSPPPHEHHATGTMSMRSKSFTWGGGANPNTADDGHAGFSGRTTSTSWPVPFVTLLLCEKAAMPASGDIPLGLTVFVAAQSPPDGWGLVPGSQERFLIGLPSGGEAGFAGGPAVGATATHRHSGTASTTLPNYDTDLARWIKNFSLGTDGDYSFAVASSDGSITLPSVTLLHCRYQGG